MFDRRPLDKLPPLGRPASDKRRSPSLPLAQRLAELLVMFAICVVAFEALLLPYRFLFSSPSSVEWPATSFDALEPGSGDDWMAQDDRGVPSDEREHLSKLHEICVTENQAIIPWKAGHVREPRSVLHRGDAGVLDELRRCPDVDVFMSGSVRRREDCEDAAAYVKFLESRLLPLWAITDVFFDPDANRSVTYHDLCPDTPMLFATDDWDGLPDSSEWPKSKPIYVTPNVEKEELNVDRANVVLCKTLGCQSHVTKRLSEQGNPNSAKVLYTRHTTSDVAHHARRVLGSVLLEPKDFNHLRFTHMADANMDKGTLQVVQSWLARPDLPPLDLYVHEEVYDALYRGINASANIVLHRAQERAVEVGKIVVESAFFVYPSSVGSYSHSINQARASGGIVVTADASPMNELISPDMGVLTKALTTSKDFQADVDPRELSDAIDYVVRNTTTQQRELMSTRAQRQYHEDTKFFAQRMVDVRRFAREHLPNGGDFGASRFDGTEAEEHTTLARHTLRHEGEV